nr:MAG TPA: hypothetical protein [Caudoviricetes sp.]
MNSITMHVNIVYLIKRIFIIGLTKENAKLLR